ncbi:MAG TPA: DUF885 family protein [Brevundimonas sp.]|jgi:uncharacterized protein (DUF885 family)|uniref:DUF885 domain-containing protein n=1 Tax=Brevundimonas sp. TaxID=1871086 RepID=UPI002DF2F497|nr:DUF885 family protein [Brevundimonas sp.]
MLNRRHLMLTAAAAAAAGPAVAAVRTEEDARLDAMLTRWLNETIDRSPTLATSLGLDRGERAHLAGKLGDSSLAFKRESDARALAQWAEIQTIDPAKLSEASKVTLAIFRFSAETAALGVALAHGGGSSPYVVTQRWGAYFSVPDFMANQHRLETPEDADAFVSRCRAFATVLDQENERIVEAGGNGVVLPAFLMDKTLTQLKTLRDMPTADWAMIHALAKKVDEKELAGDWVARAVGIVDADVKPALTRQIAVFETQRPSAVDDAGAWKLPAGAETYALALRGYTTTDYTADQIHQIGLEQVASIQAEMDGLFRRMGMTEGTVGDRIRVLNEDPQYLWPNTDEGKAQLLESLNVQMAELEPLLPRVFNVLPKSKVEIRRVPPAIELGAPGGYYQRASLDGTRPGAYYINLSNTANWPKWSLPTLTYHEASPGHHFQIALSQEAGELPLYRRLTGNSAYTEGWALYAERVAADDLGVYGDDLVGRVGYLQSYLFRAVRLVVDTGLHHKKWTRDQAIAWMVAECGEPPESAEKEIDRYIVTLGQACSYKLGQTVIEGLRQEVEAKGDFDIKAFHDAVLLDGIVPLSVLQERVRARFA